MRREQVEADVGHAARTEDASDLLERSLRVIDVFEHREGVNEVERLVVERHLGRVHRPQIEARTERIDTEFCPQRSGEAPVDPEHLAAERLARAQE